MAKSKNYEGKPRLVIESREHFHGASFNRGHYRVIQRDVPGQSSQVVVGETYSDGHKIRGQYILNLTNHQGVETLVDIAPNQKLLSRRARSAIRNHTDYMRILFQLPVVDETKR